MYQIRKPLGLIWSNLWTEKLFLAGLAIKLILIIALTPLIQQELFVPFIVNWIQSPISLPWATHLSSGGELLAFPYGLVMFIFHLPTTILGYLIDQFLTVEYFSNIGFQISLLVADILLLLILLQAFESLWKKILLYYWLSPLVLFITYWHGQTDIIPVALFIYSLTLVKHGNYWASGVILACAVAAKHSMLLGAPFIIIYLLSHNGIHKEFQKFIAFFIGALLLIEAPFFFSDAFQIMVLENQEVGKIYSLFIPMGKNNLIYLTPLVYLLLVYFYWRIRRINFDLLVSAMGVAFSIIILMTPSSPGWYLWLVPIFTLHQSRYSSGSVTLIGVFSILFITFHFLHNSGASLFLLGNIPFNFSSIVTPKIQSIHYTLMVGFGLLIAIQILREGVSHNDYYRLGNKPLLLGISGNSGVGKSTFSKSLATIFGEYSLVEVSGDDYHNWGRTSPMWRTLTHLDPRANRLFNLVKDVRRLMEGKEVQARQYDHKTGHFLPKKIKKSKNVILVEGLHSLYPKQLLEEFDVRFFINMEETLRSFLSKKRDIDERGHNEESVLKEAARRKADVKKYIEPQAERADIVFTLLPINKELLKQDHPIESNIKLQVCLRNGIYYQELAKVLIGVCGLQVNLDSVDERGEIIIEISGDIDSEDVALAAHMLAPHMEELLDFGALFSEGIIGVMQIITIMEINEALMRRRLT